tara:strand:- start:103 stop:570 length:468 start_codon:yes stop_codon:yes gene_type:complete
MSFFNKHYNIITILILTILLGCQLQDPDKSHGIVFLENRSNKLTLNKSNKNDVIRTIGVPHIKDEQDENNWIYLERILSKGKYHKLGKHELKKNNVLVLTFDKFGILNSKSFFTKDEMNKLKFSKKVTDNDLTKKSFVQSFLQSIKQKMYGGKSN